MGSKVFVISKYENTQQRGFEFEKFLSGFF